MDSVNRSHELARTSIQWVTVFYNYRNTVSHLSRGSNIANDFIELDKVFSFFFVNNHVPRFFTIRSFVIRIKFSTIYKIKTGDVYVKSQPLITAAV